MSETPTLSVCMITFNQAAFIEQSLAGVLQQEVGFPVEVVVADDASTDGSSGIISERLGQAAGFQTRHIRHPHNLGMMANFMFALKQCRGRYIALCEGDDYWTDPGKLQKQVDFLEANPDISLCYHPVDVLFPDGHTEEDFIIRGIMPKAQSGIHDMAALGNYIHTPSVVFRNRIREFPSQFAQSPVGDYFLYMLLGRFGDYYRLADNMAVYRYGVGGYSTLDKAVASRRWEKTLSLVQQALDDKTTKTILRHRLDSRRLGTLPEKLQRRQSFAELASARELARFAPAGALSLALLRKLLRR